MLWKAGPMKHLSEADSMLSGSIGGGRGAWSPSRSWAEGCLPVVTWVDYEGKFISVVSNSWSLVFLGSASGQRFLLHFGFCKISHKGLSCIQADYRKAPGRLSRISQQCYG